MKVKHKHLRELGRKIRCQREMKGISQEELANLADIDRAYFGGIERGERNVATLNLIKIASAIEVEVGELFPSLAQLRKASDER